jgi:transcriptional regulator with XRE-family HTH domain
MKSGPPLDTRELGSRLRTLRQDCGLTIEALARRSKISVGLLSQLERGQGNPSLATITKVAAALGVQIGEFFPGRVPRQRLVRKDERKILQFAGPGLRYELLSPDLTGRIELLWITIPPHYSGEQHPFVHEGEEAGIVLKGELEVHTGGDVYHLHAGDSIAYPCSISHWTRNPSSETTVLVWAISPPSF